VRIANAVADVAFVGRMPPLEVRTMFAILARGNAPARADTSGASAAPRVVPQRFLAPGELFSRQQLEAAGDRWRVARPACSKVRT
jgi:hypothetical protein